MSDLTKLADNLLKYHAINFEQHDLWHNSVKVLAASIRANELE